MESPPEERSGRDDRTWLRRLLGALVPFRIRDVIAAEIGDNASSVVVGKNIIQIGRVEVSTFPLIAMILLIAGISGFNFYSSRGPTEMSGEFKIAVAQFGQLDSSGKVRLTQDSKNLSQWLFERLQTEYTSLQPSLNPQVWHDSLDLGVKLGLVSGASPEERYQAVSRLAERINADVVIYGNLSAGEGAAHFIPEFYVAELADAPEITGPHELGTPIQMQLPIERLGNRLQFNQKLASRARALTLFTLGLAWEYSGRPDTALDLYREAAAIEDWADHEGKEVVYLFIGREAFFLWEQGQDLEEEVRSSFERALDLNPGYARANVGMGNYYSRQAVLTFKSPEGDLQEALEILDSAVAEYRKALGSGYVIPGRPIEVPATLGISGAYRLKGEVYLRLLEPERAAEYLNLAIAEANNAVELTRERKNADRALAFLNLGTAHHFKAHNMLTQGSREESLSDFVKAREAYSSCLAIDTSQVYDWYLEMLVNDYCRPYEKVVGDVLDELQGGAP